MKVILAFLLVVGLSGTFLVNANPKPYIRALDDDLKDFFALVPKDEIHNIILEYLNEDEEVQHIMKYVQSSEFRELVKSVESIPDVTTFYNYLQESGLDIYDLVNKLHDLIGLPTLISPRATIRTASGVTGLITDIKAILPIDNIKSLYDEKLKTSEKFRKLVQHFHSPRFQTVVDLLVSNSEFQNIIKKAKEVGIDVRAVADLFSTIFGLEFSKHEMIRISRGLHDDLDDFFAIVPKNKIWDIFLQYVAYDAEVKYVLEYAQTSEFRELVKLIESIPDVIDFYKYLQESGLDIKYIMNYVHKFIGLDPILLRRGATVRITGGVAGLIADIKAVLPIDQIKDLYNKKLQESEEFKNLVDRLQSPKFQAIVNTLLANLEVQKIIKMAKDFGVDIQTIADLLSMILGLEFPKPEILRISRELHDDFEDFVALMPKEKISNIFNKYVTSDDQVQYVIEYVQTSEFRELVKVVETIPDVKNFYKYLHESGLDIYDIVNRLHDFIGLAPLIPSNRSWIQNRSGVSGLIADIKEVLPIHNIKALYYQKLETSESFKNLVERLQSPKFQVVVDTLINNPEFQQLLQKAKAVGVDVKAITELLTTIFGLEFPSSNAQIIMHTMYINIDEFSNNTTLKRIYSQINHMFGVRESQSLIRPLKDDFYDFITLLPLENIVIIGMKYICFDSNVQEAAQYVQSQELKDLAMKIQEDPEVYQFLKYLEDSGADIFELINILNVLLQIPPYQLPIKRIETRGNMGGVQGMLNEIRAILPYGNIKAMYDNKMETSYEFHYFIGRLKNSAFQDIVDKIVANKNVLDLGHQAELHGINIETIAKFLTEIFGIQLPDPPYFPTDFHTNERKNNLSNDFADFYHILPHDRITQLAFDYIMLDNEMQELIKYIRSDDFKNVIRHLHGINEYRQILAELEDADVDVNYYIEKLHNLIGYELLLRNNRDGMKWQKVITKPGLSGFIESVKDLLPYEKIKALYREKLKTSEAFVKFIELISSKTFQTCTNMLFANEEFQDVLHEAQTHGVNLQLISDFFLNVFGITTPPGIIN